MDYSLNVSATLRKYLTTLIHIMSWKVALALGLMICLSTMEGISLLMLVRLREKLYRAIANTNWLIFARNRASDFTHALTIEMERIGAATYYILNLLATGIVAIVYILFALKLSATMTGLVFLCGVGLMFLLRKKT